jgi:hypothetical protein
MELIQLRLTRLKSPPTLFRTVCATRNFSSKLPELLEVYFQQHVHPIIL